MNQSFLLKATPQIARRLVRLAKLVKIDLDPYISELAARDLIDAWPPGVFDQEREFIQFVADCNYRCIVVHNESVGQNERDGEVSILRALKMSRHRPILLITSDNRWEWQAKAKKLHLRFHFVDSTEYVWDEKHEVLIFGDRIERIFNNTLLRAVRDGVLLMDMDDHASRDLDLFTGLCKEFERTVLSLPTSALSGYSFYGYGNHRRLVHSNNTANWFNDARIVDLAKALHPTSGLAHLLVEDEYNFNELMKRGVLNPHPARLAPLLGVSTHLMTKEEE